MQLFDKKRRERMFLDAFLDVTRLSPTSIEHDDAPDFVLQFPDQRVAIEVREIVREPAIGMEPHREQERLRWKLAASAQALWRARGLPAVHVTLHFNPHQPLRLADLRDAAEATVNVAESRLPVPGSWSSPKGLDEFPRQLPKAVHTLGIGRFEHLTESTWVPADSGWVPSITPAQLQVLIDQKNVKRPRYRPVALEFWLLLCIDGFTISGTFKLEDSCETTTYSTVFDRVGCIDRGRNHVTWFSTSRRGG